LTTLGENKVESLMRQGAMHLEIKVEPFEEGLGIRISKLVILNQKDCIKIKPKEWLDLKVLHEIKAILRVWGFSWLANGKDSCWIK
jgi:hypothetical protein